jgi:DNA (cytosine-5)-methyltransferase 1
LTNFPGTPSIPGDIRSVPTDALLEAGGLDVGEAGLVIGGPPCTPFSKSGFWLAEKRESRDPNASLLDEYVRVVRETRPEAFILENVQGLTYRTHRAQLDRLLRSLTDLGYNPQMQVLLAADFGVPQLRKRLFIVGRRDGRTFEFPAPTHSGDSEHTKRRLDDPLPIHVTAGQAFEGLADVPETGELVEGEFGELAAEIPAGRNYLWHTERGGGRDMFRWRSRYWTFLLRLSPDKPSSTVQAQPGPYVGPLHWENLPNANGAMRARRLRVPEIKRLQTFPDTFEIVGDRATAQRQLGNAVPVELGKAVAHALAVQLGHIEERVPSLV